MERPSPPSYDTIASGSRQGPISVDPDALPYYGESSTSTILSPTGTIDNKLPNHFRVAGHYITPLLRPSDLLAHLRLLGAFLRLRQDVYDHQSPAGIRMEGHERWAVFLERAVYRFQCWASRMLSHSADDDDPTTTRSLAAEEYPPLDVVMVWHTYLLNPRTYYEDGLRKLRGLLKVGSVTSGFSLPHVTH